MTKFFDTIHKMLNIYSARLLIEEESIDNVV